LDSASDALNMVLTLKREYMSDKHFEIALTYSHLGRVAAERGEMEGAEDLFDEAQMIARFHGTVYFYYYLDILGHNFHQIYLLHIFNIYVYQKGKGKEGEGYYSKQLWVFL